jgi:MarR family transcriptional regulator, organic hydroperoxide resistance regulator
MNTKRHLLTPLDDAIAFRISRLARLLRQGFASDLQQWTGEELTPEQYFALYRLRQRGLLPMQALADPVLQDFPNMSRVVAALQKRGLVKRSADKTDKRVQLCALTPAGEALFDKLYPSVVAERARLFEGWTARDLRQLSDGLQRLEGLLERDPRKRG